MLWIGECSRIPCRNNLRTHLHVLRLLIAQPLAPNLGSELTFRRNKERSQLGFDRGGERAQLGLSPCPREPMTLVITAAHKGTWTSISMYV